MTANPLDFGLHWSAEEDHRAILRVIDDAIAQVGLDVAAGACRADAADVRNAVSERNGRHLRVRWAQAIARIAPLETRIEIARAFVGPLGLDVVPAKELTPEQKIERLTGALRGFGEQGERAIRDALEGRKP